MLSINGRRYCEYCLNEITGRACPTQHPFEESIPMALASGTVLLKQYVIARVLGKGGFGITYLAFDVINNRKVAIKEYFPSTIAYREGATARAISVTGSQQEVFTSGAEKFYEEASLIARFNGNPAIIDVYEFFYENGTAYYVMEYLDGYDLKKYIRNNGGRINERLALEIADRVCDALIYIHAAGVLHRDISPDNIFMCSSGRVVLIDFGAARHVLSEQSQSLSVILKHSFAPLEQYQKRGNQGPWSDIYALGMTLYYSVTGIVPDDATSRIVEPELHYPFDAAVSGGFGQLIERMTNVNIEQRPQTASELKQLIFSLRQTGTLPPVSAAPQPYMMLKPSIPQQVQQVQPIIMPGQPPIEQPPIQRKTRSAGKTLALIFGIVVAVVALVIGIVLLLTRDKGLEQPGGYDDYSGVSINWNADVVCNDVMFSFDNDYESLSRYDDVIFNMQFWGPDDESISAYYIMYFPDGTSERSEIDDYIYSGDEYCCGWYDGIYYNGDSGTISIYVYERSTGACIGTSWIKIYD